MPRKYFLLISWFLISAPVVVVAEAEKRVPSQEADERTLIKRAKLGNSFARYTLMRKYNNNLARIHISSDDKEAISFTKMSRSCGLSKDRISVMDLIRLRASDVNGEGIYSEYHVWSEQNSRGQLVKVQQRLWRSKDDTPILDKPFIHIYDVTPTTFVLTGSYLVDKEGYVFRPDTW